MKYVPGIAYFGLLNPVSLALNPAVATCIEQGMECYLFPGEYLIVDRGGHTVGSTMSATFQFIEIDIPLYDYDEPQVVKRQQRAVGTLKERVGNVGGGTRVGILAPGPKGPRGPLSK